jgi:tetratricopeptide repeat protein 30
VYERLSKFYPDIKEYRFYYAQSLYKSNQSAAAQKVCHSLAEEKEFQSRVLKLEAAIKFDAQDIAGSKILIDRLRKGVFLILISDDAETMTNQACFLYKEGKYQEAKEQYVKASKISGFNPELAYNIALCNYKLKKYVSALKHIADIVEKGIRDHPGILHS